MSEEIKNYSEAEQTAEFASDRTEVKENPPEDRTAEPSAEPSAEKKTGRYTKGQRIAALIGAVLLAGMVIATLICAICGAPSNVTFALLFCDIILPIMLWVFIKVTAHYKKLGEERS